MTKFTVYDFSPSKHVRGVFETKEAALNYLVKIGCVVIEPDADHPGCFDALTKFGEVMAVEMEEAA